jgi:hypothetical protein
MSKNIQSNRYTALKRNKKTKYYRAQTFEIAMNTNE